MNISIFENECETAVGIAHYLSMKVSLHRNEGIRADKGKVDGPAVRLVESQWPSAGLLNFFIINRGPSPAEQVNVRRIAVICSGYIDAWPGPWKLKVTLLQVHIAIANVDWVATF